MSDSRRLAGLLGPTLIALAGTEALNMDIFAAQTAPVVYLNGAILFVAGLALVRAHNRWSWRWPVLVTVTGWLALIGGAYRMLAPDAPQAGNHPVTYAGLAILGAVGAVLTYAACPCQVRRRRRNRPQSASSPVPAGTPLGQARTR